MWLLILFIAIPLVEIALFIQVGGFLGLWPTLAIVLMTAILGSWLVRGQGLMALGQVKSSFSNLNDPTEPLAHGAMIIFSGALLVPQIRSIVFRYFRSKITVQGFGTQSSNRSRKPESGVIDGEFTDVTPEKSPTHGPSGWTKH